MHVYYSDNKLSDTQYRVCGQVWRSFANLLHSRLQHSKAARFRSSTIRSHQTELHVGTVSITPWKYFCLLVINNSLSTSSKNSEEKKLCLNFEYVKKMQLVTSKNRKKNHPMGQKFQVGGSAVLKSKSTVQCTNRLSSWGRGANGAEGKKPQWSSTSKEHWID